MKTLYHPVSDISSSLFGFCSLSCPQLLFISFSKSAEIDFGRSFDKYMDVGSESVPDFFNIETGRYSNEFEFVSILSTLLALCFNLFRSLMVVLRRRRNVTWHLGSNDMVKWTKKKNKKQKKKKKKKKNNK